jgi:hypothetical protein
MRLSPYALYYDGFRIIPAPTISIVKNFVYVNDVISGYTYTVNLKGYASSTNPLFAYASNESNIDKTIRSIDRVHTVFHKNGGYLQIDCNNSPVLSAFGGQLRSFSVSDTDNNWVNYATYDISLEFNELQINSLINNIPNVEVAFDTVNGIVGSPLSNYNIRIKQYKDGWSFSTSDEEIHSYYTILSNDNISSISEDYTTINVEYKIDATGKHYFETNGTLIPAWDRAKQFVQEKLASQILMFRRDAGPTATEDGRVLSNNVGRTAFPLADSNRASNPIPYNSNTIPLIPEDLLINSHTGYTNGIAAPTHPPLLGFLITQGYGVFNEKILCATSESDGTFSATYSCVLKRFTSDNFMRNATHTYDITYSENNDFQTSTRNINIQGNIQGLLPTNILKSTGFVSDGTQMYLSLPSNGPFIASSPDITSKYYYAWYHFMKDIVNEDFSDLRENFKRALSINYATLFPETGSDIPCVEDENGGGYLALFQLLAKPRTFSISHNYNDGAVLYSAEYDTERSCSADRGFEDLTVTEEDPVPILAEFIVPGRSAGPIIQNLETYTNKKITLSFTGVTKKGCIEGNPWQEEWEALNPGEDIFDFVNLNVNIPPIVNAIIRTTEKSAEEQNKKLIKTNDSYNYNPIDGSFSVNVSYIVCPDYLGTCAIVEA